MIFEYKKAGLMSGFFVVTRCPCEMLKLIQNAGILN